jgi:hypothetical protein
MTAADIAILEANQKALEDYIEVQQDALGTDQPLSKTIQAWLATRGLSAKHKRWLNMSATSELEHEYGADVEWMSTYYFDSDEGDTSDNDCVLKDGFVQVGGCRACAVQVFCEGSAAC